MSGAVSTIALTGHRRLPPGAPALIRAEVGELVGLHPGATWLAGGAVGADQVAADEVLRRGERLELVLPFPPAVQAARWAPSQLGVLLEQVRHAAAVEVLAPTYDVAALHRRNRRLVERADLLVAFYDGREGGGTAATINEARRYGVEVRFVSLE